MYAHSRNARAIRHPLRDHLFEVGRLARTFASPFGGVFPQSEKE